MRGGPAGAGVGAVKQVGAIAVGTDPVALDAWAATIFDLRDDEMSGSLRIAEEMGLGTTDFGSLQPIEI
jgi:hypothetical protein